MAQNVKLRMTRNAIAGGQPRAIGDIVKVDAREARLLVGIKRAEPHDKAAEKATEQLGLEGGLTTESAGATVKGKK